MNTMKAAIVGIGTTELSMKSGRSIQSLAVEACQNAITDSGLGIEEVDGILTFSVGDSVSPESICTSLAMPQINYLMDWYSGGIATCALVGLAEMLVNSNTCKSVLIYRALNGRSGARMGNPSELVKASGSWQHRMPHGYVTFVETMAFWLRRYKMEYGLKDEQLGAISINQRKNAVQNDRAVQRKPLTMEDYLSSRMIADPLRLYDITLETDGACALLITSADRAKDCKQTPVYIAATSYIGFNDMGNDWADFFLRSDMTENFTVQLASKLYGRTQLNPSDIDVAEIYDCFTHTVLLALEGLGFCKKGEGGEFVESGAIGLGGTIPVNTHGGMMSEGNIHGVNTAAEAVRQLRGDGGCLQVQAAKNAIVTSGSFQSGSGMILTNQDKL